MTTLTNTRILTAAAALMLVADLASAQATAKWTPDDMMKVHQVGGPQPSPDGRWVAFTVNDAVMTDDKSEYLTHLWLAAGDGSRARQLTFGDKSSTSPQWSADGQWLVFTSSRSGKNNLWRMHPDGGEAEQLTDVKTAVGAFAIAPDGRSIAFTMTDALSDAEDRAKKQRDDAIIVGEGFKVSRLWVVPAEKDPQGKREPRLLTRENVHVGGGLGGGGALEWSPDGRTIVFAHLPTPSQNDWTEVDLSTVDVASGRRTPLAATKAAETDAHFSPDGKWIAFTASDNPPTWAFVRHVYIVAAGGGAPRRLALTHDEQPNIVGWSADGRAIYFTESVGTFTRLSAIPLDGGAPKLLDAGDRNLGGAALDATRSLVVFASDRPDEPTEVYSTRLDRWAPARVTRINADAPRHALGRTEAIRWKSKDGMDVEGLLTYPVGYRQGQRVPLLVVVHGGPTGVFTQGFIGARGTYPVAAFASEGFAVLRPNPRGSSGYGRKFRYANYNDWGGGDLQDILSGVDHVVSSGVADSTRMGIMGWSYGGYMTSFTITQTKRFKAASVGAGMTNLMSFTGTSDVSGFMPDYFRGDPWDDLEPYRARSAMFHVKNVVTPTLIQHGEQDARVPASQGYELYNGLKRQGKTVKMIVYPRQPHGVSEPRLMIDAARRNVDWFARYLLGRAATWVP